MSVLINKQYRDYVKVSRYASTPFYFNSLDEKYMYGISFGLKKTDTPYVSHTVKRNDTLDSLALYYYNNPTYFWVIADFNSILDPYEKLDEGKVLRIPTFSNLQLEV